MKPTPPVAEDAALSREVAVEAGRMLVELRAGFGPLDPGDRAGSRRLRDAADAAAHDLIAARLAERRPHDALLSEEGVDDPVRLRADRVWIVDPLDGTWEYGQGRRDWAVHVALWQPGPTPAGRLSAGTVDLPAMGVTWSQDGPVRAAHPLPGDRPVRLVVSRSRPPHHLDRVRRALARLLGADVEIVNVGSVGAKVGELLAGRADAYVHDTGFHEWDVAAPLAVAAHHGFVGTHVDGTPVALNRPSPYVDDVVVAHPDVHAALLGALA